MTTKIILFHLYASPEYDPFLQDHSLAMTESSSTP